LIGIAGGPMLVIGYLAVLSNTIGQHGGFAGLSALPVAIFEFSLGVWLIVKGFDPDAVAALDARTHISLDIERIARGPATQVEATSVGGTRP
jgi:hypothetical protein